MKVISDGWNERIVHASFYLLALRVTTRLLAFIRNIVIARILAPEDVGLFALVLVVLTMLERFSATGLRGAVVQKHGDVAADLDTVWTIQAGRAVLLCAVLVTLAHPIAALLGVPESYNAVRILGVVVLLRGCSSVGLLEFRRQLEVDKRFKVEAVRLCVDLLVSVALSIVLRTAWGLLIGLVAGYLAQFVVSYAVHPYRPRLRYIHKTAVDLRRVGVWLFINNMLQFLVFQGDRLVVGRFLGTGALGIYMLALALSGGLATQIKHVSADIVFPAVARLQTDVDRVRRGYLRMLSYSMLFTLPLASALSLLAEPITLSLLGPNWGDVALLLPALAFAAVARSIVTSASFVFSGLGRPELSVRQTLISLVVTYIGFGLAISEWGIRAIGASILLGLVAAVPSAFFQLRRLIRLSLGEVLAALYPGVVLSVAVGLSIAFALRLPLLQGNGMPETLALLLVGLSGYLAASWMLHVQRQTGPLDLLLTTLRKLKSRRQNAESNYVASQP